MHGTHGQPGDGLHLLRGALKGSSVQYEVRSHDGGVSFTRPEAVATVIDVGLYDPATDDYSLDGVGGARTNSYPSVDIANGAPDGENATDEIVMMWSDGETPSDEDGGPNEQALVTYSTDGGVTAVLIRIDPEPDSRRGRTNPPRLQS